MHGRPKVLSMMHKMLVHRSTYNSADPIDWDCTRSAACLGDPPSQSRKVCMSVATMMLIAQDKLYVYVCHCAVCIHPIIMLEYERRVICNRL
jgi:hypothetical protein